MLQQLEIICAPVLSNCVPELISNMPYEDLMVLLDETQGLLTDITAVTDTDKIIALYTHVLEVRKDAATLLTENVLPLVVRVMVQAEQAGRDWQAASRALVLLSRHYMDFTVCELQTAMTPDACPPLSLQHTLSRIMAPTTSEPLSPISPDRLNSAEVTVESCVRKIIAMGGGEAMLKMIRPVCKSSNISNKRLSLAVTSELLKYNICMSRGVYSRIINDVLTALRDSDTDVRLAAIQCLINIIESSPKEARKISATITEALLRTLRGASVEVLPAVLRALMAVVRMEDRRSCHGNDRILLRVLRYINCPGREDVQLSALQLINELIKRYWRYPCSNIRTIVKEQLVAILTKMQSMNTHLSSAAAACLHTCLPHLGCSTGQLEGRYWGDPQYEDSIYRTLAAKHLLKKVLLEAVKKLTICLETEDLVRLIDTINEFVPRDLMSSEDLNSMVKDLRKALSHPVPDINHGAGRVVECLIGKWTRLAAAWSTKGVPDNFGILRKFRIRQQLIRSWWREGAEGPSWAMSETNSLWLERHITSQPISDVTRWQ